MTDASVNSSATMWPAPAKLNLFLHITGQREDGFHLLQTVFQFLDVGDRLYFRLRDDGVIGGGVDMPGLSPEQDLTLRAARLLQQSAGVTQGVDIEVDKQLPSGGGLGGGSSDAATVLVALNRLWGLNWPNERLAQLGARLGADVPVFIHGRAAWAEGAGEQLTPVELPEPWYVVIFPRIHVSTAEIFSAPDLTRDCAPITIRAFLAGRGINVCESVACRHYPEVASALQWLSQSASARMTGTGSCVFAAFPDEQTARGVADRVPPQWQGFVARGLNRSPLLEVACTE